MANSGIRYLLDNAGLVPIVRPIYRFMKSIVPFIVYQINRLGRINYLNIGGGPYFAALGWMNLEEVPSIINPSPFKLDYDCTFPINDESIAIVNTSHCLEHLDDATVLRTLHETFRVLKNDGKLVIKLPDYDRALAAWRERDKSYFNDKLWDYQSAVSTWKNRGIEDSLDNRASMLFCGFWNDDYGDHFSKRISKDAKAYHGPAVISVDFLRKLIMDATPSKISKELSQIVIAGEKGYHFNHRNSWSRQELKDLLSSCGFKSLSFSKEYIMSKYNRIPGIRAMEAQSMYCLAGKN